MASDPSEMDRMDMSVPFMVLVIKTTSFAWSAHDGTLPNSLLSPIQLKYSIVKFPSLIEFYGFIFFFGGFLVGPSIQFNDYLDFIRLKGDFKDMPTIRYRVLPTLQCLGSAVLSFLLASKFDQIYDYNIAISKEFLDRTSFSQRFQFMMLCGFIARQKYYTAWRLSEGACNLAGIGFTRKNAKTGHLIFERTKNIKIFSIEFPNNLKHLIDSWNINTSLWLRNDVYLRLANQSPKAPEKKPTFQIVLMTFLTSAFWHGFWAGYYLFFGAASVANSAARVIRKCVRPRVLKLGWFWKGVYDLVGTFTTMMTINFLAAPFQLLTLEKTLRFYNSLYWFYFGILGVVMGLSYAGVLRPPRVDKSDLIHMKEE